MPITFCPACNTKISLGQQVTVAAVKCPRCGGRVPTAPAPAPAQVAAAPPVARTPERPRAAAPRPIAPPPPPPAEVEEVILEAEEAPRRRRKKKMRRRLYRDEPESSGKPIWFWALVGGLGLLTLAGAGVGVFFALKSGIAFNLATMAIVLAIAVPANVVIFIAGVYIGNALGAGIDLGEAHIAIAKAVLLLLVISIIDTIPIDYISLWLGLPVLIIGVVLLFHLDPWESRFLVAIYCCLKLVFTLVMVMAIESGVLSGGGDRDGPSRPITNQKQWNERDEMHEFDEDVAPEPNRTGSTRSPSKSTAGAGARGQGEKVVDHQALLSAAYRRIKELGGYELRHPHTNDIMGINFTNNTKLTDDDLAHIGLLTTISGLDLAGTSITDKGLLHLKRLHGLAMVDARRTKVTEAGVRELQKFVPGVRVILKDPEPG